MPLNIVFFGALLMGWSYAVNAAQAIHADGLHRHVEEHVRTAITQAFDHAVQPQPPLELHIEVGSPRGAALQPCPAGWRWGALNTQDWRRIHIPVQCAGERGSWVARVQATAMVWVLRDDRPAGHRIQRSDLELQRLRIDSPHAMPTWHMLQDMQLRLPMQAGQLLVLRDLERPVYAQKGQTLEIWAHNGGISVVAQGVSSKEGRKGDTLKVRNTQSQQWVQGTLVAPGVLQAQPQQATAQQVKVQLESSD